MGKRKFRIEFDLQVDLSEDQIWPDGDAPAKITRKDIYEVMFGASHREPYGFEILQMLNEWDLADDGVFSVSQVVEMRIKGLE